MERTSKLLHNLRFRHRILNSQLTKLKIISFILNSILITIGVILFSAVLSIISYPTWLKMFISLQKITLSYAILIWIVLFCIASISLGIIGIFAIHRKATLILGIQIFALVFLAVLEGGILYTILVQWLRHLEVGVTFAVQMFQPGLEDNTVMANIQEALHCCGRGSYDDYGVANEAIPKHYVPYSCCDLQTYTIEHCNNASILSKSKLISTIQSTEENNLLYVIPYHMAYTVGCVNRLKHLFLPIIISCFCLLIFVNLFVTFVNCFYVQKAADEEEYEQNWLNSQNFMKETKEAFCLRPQKQVEITEDITTSIRPDLSVFQRQLSRRRTNSTSSNLD
ncbi:tetraspanin family isoform 2 [Schistosoma japonicum]|uniref:Tetraspanin family isoform 2 n=1 Tax=Schistosoma japonicum TaxID=6182 RepID=A0A4Z2D3T8_SCHJA|nr:tetraspanin family isoform 2 [Schistosoma japonicum]